MSVMIAKAAPSVSHVSRHIKIRPGKCFNQRLLQKHDFKSTWTLRNYTPVLSGKRNDVMSQSVELQETEAEETDTLKEIPLNRKTRTEISTQEEVNQDSDVGPLGIVITGGSKGFGFALAAEHLSYGDRVLLCSRSAERAQMAAEELKARFPGAEVFGVKCDVSSSTDVRLLADVARVKLGTVDRWINNAAHISEKVPLFEVDPADLEAVVGTNVLGSFLCCREAVLLMREQQGSDSPDPIYHIFNFGFSPWGAALSSTVCTHKASKSSLAQLNSSLSKELKAAGVTNIGIHNLSPGMVLTDLLLKGSSPVARRIFNALAEEPETIAAALVPEVRSITGTNKRIEYLTLGSAVYRMVTGIPQILNGGRFFDKAGRRVQTAGDKYKSNGVRLLYDNASTMEEDRDAV